MNKNIIVFLVILILILFLLNISKNKYFVDTNLKSRILNTDYIFIHIPKNAGTSFGKKYCGKEVGHRRANSYDIKDLKKSVAIIRNPYDRIKSCYKYFKMDNNYWSKKYGNPKYHDYCKKNTFKQFVNDLHSKKIQFDIHLSPQVYFLKKNGVIYTKLIRLENMNKDFKKIFNKEIDLPLINKSDDIDIKIDTDTKNKIYDIYKADFELLGYKK